MYPYFRADGTLWWFVLFLHRLCTVIEKPHQSVQLKWFIQPRLHISAKINHFFKTGVSKYAHIKYLQTHVRIFGKLYLKQNGFSVKMLKNCCNLEVLRFESEKSVEMLVFWSVETVLTLSGVNTLTGHKADPGADSWQRGNKTKLCQPSDLLKYVGHECVSFERVHYDCAHYECAHYDCVHNEGVHYEYVHYNRVHKVGFLESCHQVLGAGGGGLLETSAVC